MKISKSEKDLISSYDAVSCLFQRLGNLKEQDFQSSRSLFQQYSLEIRSPSPKNLEVVAVVAGLPFTPVFQEKLVSIQLQIQEIIGDTLAYWVQPKNLALEFLYLNGLSKI